ncbi:hypothetical protein B296_00042125 [Ensete ventricosum]|uniref:Uncharacterized protein n=1 Tax=Ensete ventricosum TaxID=4639 RepID=A0A426ZJJ8_ENSVE|nr:hypothetical protein B296_00042125 [Ensete ventricosum]
MAPEPEDDTNEKNPRPLDEDDIALLKTYVSCPSSAASPSLSFPLFDLSSNLLFPLPSSLRLQVRVVRRFFIKNQCLFLFPLSFLISSRIFRFPLRRFFPPFGTKIESFCPFFFKKLLIF